MMSSLSWIAAELDTEAAPTAQLSANTSSNMYWEMHPGMSEQTVSANRNMYLSLQERNVSICSDWLQTIEPSQEDM